MFREFQDSSTGEDFNVLLFDPSYKYSGVKTIVVVRNKTKNTTTTYPFYSRARAEDFFNTLKDNCSHE